MNRSGMTIRLALVLGLVVGVSILVRQKESGAQVSTPVLESAEFDAQVETDTMEETLNTLLARIIRLQRQLEEQSAIQANLSRDDLDMQEGLLSVRQELEALNQGRLSVLERQFEQLDGKLQSMVLSRRNESYLPAAASVPARVQPGSEAQWIQPLDPAMVSTGPELPSRRPAYTIPPQTTLFDAVGLTALIGRVAQAANATGPLPVKVIIGRRNLAANGYSMPGLSGMVFGGFAKGDWSLSCVTVSLVSATYVMEDGTFQTLGRMSSGAEPLAWVSNRQGLPCIPGRRISTAGKDLLLRWSLDTAQGFAAARAREQLTRTFSVQGNVQETLTGDASRFARNEAVQRGLETVEQYLRQRLEQHFDAVYVQPGAGLVVHVGQELAIDHDPKARKLAWREEKDVLTHPRLD